MLNPDPQDPIQFLDLPPWFNFSPYTLVLGMDKCGSNNSINDADCYGQPFETEYTIVIKASLNDSYQTINSEASFRIVVGVNCQDDYFSFITT